MSRRGRGGTTISLFAFQDIITSVTAILIVLVLFLSLELINAKESRQKPSTESEHPDRSAQIDELKTKLSELQNTPRLDAAELQELGNNTPASMTITLRVAIERRDALLEELSNLKEKYHEAEVRVDDAKQDFDAEKDNVQLIQSLESQIAELRTLIESASKSEKIWFSLPAGFNGKGWVVLVESDSLFLASMKEEMRPVRIKEGGVFSGGLASQLIRWIRQENHTNEYFLVLIRPEGAEAADEITKQLKVNEINFGFDVVSDSEDVMDAEKGVRLQ